MKALTFPNIVTTIVVLFLSGTASAADKSAAEHWSPAALTYYTENYPPANYLDNGKLTGLTVESLRLIWNAMGVPPQPVHLVPWARGYRETLQTPGTVLFTMSRTPAREALFKWVGPIFVAHQVLIARKDFSVAVSSVKDVSDVDIAVVRDDVTSTALIKAGHSADHTELVTHGTQAIEMLDRGRVDLIMMSLLGFQKTLEQKGSSMDEYKPVLRINSYGNYIAFQRDTPDALVKRFQDAFKRTQDQRQALLGKYGMSSANSAAFAIGQ